MKRLWIIVPVAAVMAVGAWMVVAHQGNGSEGSSESGSANPGDRAGGTRLSAREGVPDGPLPFTVLRSKAEPMPPRLRRLSVRNLGGASRSRRLGLDFGRAQYVHTAVGNGIWIVRGAGITCIFQARKAASACAGNRYVVKMGLSLVVGVELATGSELPRHFLALAIAPDGVEAVRLKVLGGASTTVPVADNAYAFRADAPINIERFIPEE